MTDRKYLLYEFQQFNNQVPLDNTVEPGTLVISINVGGTNGGVLTQLSIGYGANFQNNAYIKVEVTGLNIQPATYQAVSATFNTYNLVASGDSWDLPPNAMLNIYVYNHGAGANPELFDVIATAKQWLS